MRLYKKTTIGRQNLTPIARIVLGPEVDAPEGSFRRVQIVVPPSPQLFLMIDKGVQGGFSEDGIGPDRNYQMPFLQPGQRTELNLAPEQFLTMSSVTALGNVSILVEYLAP